MSQVTVVVPAEAAGARLDRFLAGVAGLTRARIQLLIKSRDVLVNGAPARTALRLKGGEHVVIRLPPPTPLGLVPEPMPLDVLYEDEDLIALCKPAGIAVHPGAGRTSGTLVHALLAHCRDLSGIGGVLRPGIVHRLDRDTSGVLVVAKHDKSHLALARQFARREAVKRYVAFVLGVPRVRAATLDTPYGRHPRQRQRFSGRVSSPRRAITSYQVIASAGGMARLDVLLGTGRTHQIRVHLAEQGHPVVADKLYGGRNFQRITDPALREVARALSRQALHAARLELRHPTTGSALVFEAPLPADLETLWKAMVAVT